MRKNGILLLTLALILASSGMMSGTANATCAATNTGVVGYIPSVSGSIIGINTVEWDLGVDLNGDGDTDDWMIRYYDISDGSLVNVADGYDPSVSGDIIAFTTREWDIDVDLNNDGDTGDFVTRYYDISDGSLTNTGAVGYLLSVSGDIIAFVTREWPIGVDLNNDGDTDDYVVRYYDISTGLVTNTGAEGYMPSVSGSTIAFHTAEWHAGVDLNGDGDTDDYVVRYYDISDGSLVNVADGGDTSVSGSIITFMTSEWYAGDLNGDGDTDDVVIRYYDMSTGLVTNTGAVGQFTSVSGSIITFETPEWEPWWIGVDLNRDGDTDDIVIRYYDMSTGLVTNTGAVGEAPSVSGDIIAFFTREGDIGVDLNGDRDKDDCVIRYINIEGPAPFKISDQVDALSADGSIDSKGIAEALHAHLDQVHACINRGNINTAKTMLNTFIRLVEAQSGKHITTEAAQTLIGEAQALINSL